MLHQYLQEIQTDIHTVLSSEEVSLFWSGALAKMLGTLKSGGTIFVAGNGGSAADAQHFTSELVGRFLVDRKAYPAISLTTDTSALTAIGNDYGFDMVFRRQLEALASPRDCFVAITTSGQSKNILEALRFTAANHIPSILLTGRDGGEAKTLADTAIIVPSNTTSHIQEVHMMMYHCWCLQLEKLLHG